MDSISDGSEESKLRRASVKVINKAKVVQALKGNTLFFSIINVFVLEIQAKFMGYVVVLHVCVV